MPHPKVLRPLAASLALALLVLLSLPTAASAGVAFDISVSITDGVTAAVPGTSTTYTLTVSNAGPTAASPEIAPTFSQGTVTSWSCQVTSGTGDCGSSATPGPVQDFTNIGVNSVLTYTIDLAIPSSALGQVVGAITVSLVGDIEESNDTATDSDDLTPQADLAAAKDDGITAVQPGQPVTYTITATNGGPSDAPVATVADTLPIVLEGSTWTCVGQGGGTCTAAGTGDINDSAVVLPAGGSVTYTLTATVADATVAGTSITNTATVSTPTTDPNPANDAASDTDTVADFTADLVALKAAPATAVVGGTISYTIGVRNDGPDLARDVVLSDLLPAGTTFVSMTQTTGPAATLLTPAVGAGGTVQASWASLPDAAEVAFTVVVQLGGTLGVGAAVVNTATVDSEDDPVLVVSDGGDVEAAATIDPNDGNNAVTVTTAVVAQATTTTTTTTTLASTTTAAVGAGALPRTGGDPSGPTGLALIILGGGLAIVGVAELRRLRALGRI